MKKWFDGWEWLKDSAHDWNFGRFVAWQLFLINTIGLIVFACVNNGFAAFTTIWSAIVGYSGFLTGILVYGIEIVFRERTKIKVKVGDKEYGIESEK